jgi:surface antigen
VFGRAVRKRSRWCAITAIVLGSMFVSPACGWAALRLQASTSPLGGSEALLRLTATTATASTCDATVRAAHSSALRLPTLVARKRHATWQWEVPAGAPDGRWRISGVCTHVRRVSRGAASVRVHVAQFGTRAGMMFPGSLDVLAGRYLHPPSSQTVAIDTSGSKGAGGDGNPGELGYCTWGAWHLAPWLGSSVYGPPGQNDAKYWAANAGRNGMPTGTQPRVGAVFVNTSGGYGHVGVVTAVLDATTFVANEMNGGQLIPGTDAHTTEFNVFRQHQHATGPNIVFIYQPGTQPGAYIGHIVQWAGDTKTQKTAWLVGQDGKRRWIPTSAIYYCLKNYGVPGPDVLPAARLDEYPDLNGQWTNCGSSGYGAGSGDPPSDDGTATPTPTPGPGATPAPTPAPTPVPAPPTWNETVGGVAHTWTNPANAGGTQGPSIPSNATVAISCRLTGFRVADGNTWWYRIASVPWSNAFYVSADAFYNNGQTSGSLVGTPWVDAAVATC